MRVKLLIPETGLYMATIKLMIVVWGIIVKHLPKLYDEINNYLE